VSTSYIGVPVTTDSNALIQTALSNIVDSIPGWIPREGNLEVLLLEQFALMAADAATVASTVPDSIFTYYGSLIGITPNAGVATQINVTWSLLTPAGTGGITYPAGTNVIFYYNGAGYEFQLVNDLTFAIGVQTVTNVLMQASDVGAAYNFYTVVPSGQIYLNLVNPDSSTASIVVTATPATNTSLAAGVDPESSSAFLNRLTAELQLLAPRPITPYDYSIYSQNVDGVYRALSLDAYNPFQNIFSASNANWTTASATTGWSGVGNGGISAQTPTIAISGTSPSAYMQVTTGSTATPTNLTINSGATAGSTSIVINVPSGTGIDTTAGKQTLLLLQGATNTEVVVVTSASAVSSTLQTLTLAAPLAYAYASTNVVTVLQGVGNTTAISGLYANSYWLQLGAVVKAISETTLTATPILVALATYADQSKRVFSSIPGAGFVGSNSIATCFGVDSTSDYKVLTTNVAGSNVNGYFNSVAPTNTNFTSLDVPISSVSFYVTWANVGISKTHGIYYTSFTETDFDFSNSGPESASSLTSDYNFIPDANLSAYGYSNASTGSWVLGSNIAALPNLGIQFTGGNGSPVVAKSPIFYVPNTTLLSSNQTTTVSKLFTFIAKVDTSFVTSAGTSVTLSVIDDSGTAIGTPASVSTSQSGFIYIPFSIPANISGKDCRVQITFNSGVTFSGGSGSIIVSQMSVLAGTYDGVTLVAPSYYQTGYAWNPGGNFVSTSVFGAPRNVTVVPVASTGLPVSSTIQDQLLVYLTQSREANFTVNYIIPNYVPINVVWNALASPGYDPATLQTTGNAAINAFLNPGTWGGGSQTPPTWTGTQYVVQAADVASIIGAIPGIQSVLAVNLTSGLTNSSNISSITVSGTTATVATASAHGFFNGSYATIAGSSVSALNLTNVVIAVTSATTFTYTVVSGTASSSTAGMTATLTPQTSIAMSGPAPLPIGNYVSGVVTANPTDALVGSI